MNLPGEWVKRNTKVYGLNPDLQALADFEITVTFLLEIIPLKRLPTKNMKPIWMKYSTLEDFRNLCFDFCKEMAIHKDNGKLKGNRNNYSICQNLVKECIELLEENQPIMDFDMQFIADSDEKYHSFKKNWYLLIYEELQIVDRQFDFKLVIADNFTHREKAKAHLLKVEFEGVAAIPRKEQKPKKLEQAFDSLNSFTKSKTNPFRESTKTELENIILLLEEYPKAKAEAERLLKKVIEKH